MRSSPLRQTWDLGSGAADGATEAWKTASLRANVEWTWNGEVGRHGCSDRQDVPHTWLEVLARALGAGVPR